MPDACKACVPGVLELAVLIKKGPGEILQVQPRLDEFECSRSGDTTRRSLVWQGYINSTWRPFRT